MIGIRAPRQVPFVSIHRTPGIVHDLLGCAPGARILTDRLLGKDRSELCAAYRGDMTWRRKTKPVSETKGWSKSKRFKHRADYGGGCSNSRVIPSGSVK